MKILSFMIAVTGVAGVACADDFPAAASRLDGELAKVYGGTPSGNLAAVRFEKAGWADGQRYEIASSPTGVVVRAAGVKVEFLTIPQCKGRGRVEALWHSTLEVFGKLRG